LEHHEGRKEGRKREEIRVFELPIPEIAVPRITNT
jgi:hypothetical protein